MSRSANTVILLAALISGGALHAQDADRDDQQAETTEQQPSDGTDSADLEKITVSATRRSNPIDSVPVAVTAIDGDTLEESGVRDLQALQTLSPSLFVSVAGSEAGSGIMRIRGIGTSGISNPGLEPAVGVFIDGVYRPRPGAALGDLVGIDQVEVLRGPQSTLFGKNTSAGAITIQTKKPDFLPGTEVWAGAGNRDAWIAGSSITGGIIDDLLAMRLDVQAQQKDGYIDNVYDGGTINDRDRWLARAQALFTPSANVEVRLVADYAEKDEKCCAPPFTQYGPTAAAIQAVGGTIFDDPREYDVAINRTPGQTDEDLGMSAHLDWHFHNGITLNTIVSHREWTANTFGDVDYTDADIAYYDKNEIDSSFDSAEFTLAGEHGRVDWLVGAFYGSQDTDTDGRLLFGADAGAYFSLLAGGAVPPTVFPEGAGQTRIGFNQEADSWSLFTHNEIDLGRDWTLTLGARYLDESKTGGGVVESNSPGCQIPGIPPALQLLCPAPAYNTSFDDNEVVGTVGISKMYGDSGMAYLNYSKGYKAGGLNLAPTASLGDEAGLTFEPETVDAYELGLKQGFLNDRLNLRTAVFYSEFEDFQLNYFDGVSFNISNAASATSKGVEVELDYRVFDGLRLRGGVTYNDATFGHDTINEALRGQQVTNAAEWSGMAGAYYQQRLEFADASFFGNLVVRGQSETNTGANLDPNKRQGGYALVNTRVGLRFGSNWEVALWANNLTDREYNMVIIDAVTQAGSYNGFKGQPRTWGISLRKSFL